jgi:hypothetical protein
MPIFKNLLPYRRHDVDYAIEMLQKFKKTPEHPDHPHEDVNMIGTTS